MSRLFSSNIIFINNNSYESSYSFLGGLDIRMARSTVHHPQGQKPTNDLQLCSLNGVITSTGGRWTHHG